MGRAPSGRVSSPPNTDEAGTLAGYAVLAKPRCLAAMRSDHVRPGQGMLGSQPVEDLEIPERDRAMQEAHLQRNGVEDTRPLHPQSLLQSTFTR